jgi:hypothetical protein
MTMGSFAGRLPQALRLRQACVSAAAGAQHRLLEWCRCGSARGRNISGEQRNFVIIFFMPD